MRPKEKIIDAVNKYKIIAILRKVPMEKFRRTVEALHAGGIHMMEVTFDPSGNFLEENTLEQIQIISNEYSDIFVGAGTVLTGEQVVKAIQAGAEYIISPNTDSKVIEATTAQGAVSMPGAFTASEAVSAYNLGADFVKLFPVNRLGTGYVKDISAPLSQIQFLAVGGINEKNLKEYLSAGCRGVGVGSSLVNMNLIFNDKFDELKVLAETFVSAAE